MGALLNMFMKSDDGKKVAADAAAWFGGSQGHTAWSGDMPDTNVGTWWAKSYDALSNMLTQEEKKNAQPLRDQLKQWLDDWSKPANRTFKPEMDGIHQAFSSLMKTIQPSAVAGRRGYDAAKMDAFRSAGYTAMLALAAGYESAKTDAFPEQLARTQLAERCDRIYERVGDPMFDFQIDRRELASEYWSAKYVGGDGLLKFTDQITASFRTLEDPAQRGQWAATFKGLAQQISAVEKAASDPKVREVAGMLVVEAARRPLDCLRPNQPASRDKVQSIGLDASDFSVLAGRAAQHIEERKDERQEGKKPSEQPT